MKRLLGGFRPRTTFGGGGETPQNGQNRPPKGSPFGRNVGKILSQNQPKWLSLADFSGWVAPTGRFLRFEAVWRPLGRQLENRFLTPKCNLAPRPWAPTHEKSRKFQNFLKVSLGDFSGFVAPMGRFLRFEAVWRPLVRQLEN